MIKDAYAAHGQRASVVAMRIGLLVRGSLPNSLTHADRKWWYQTVIKYALIMGA